MSETKFTPGPWSVEDPMDFELAIVEANKPTHEWRFIATCSLPDGDDDQAFTGREIHANANLIAAAPELYEAVKEARDVLHQHYVDWEGEPEDAVPLQLARAKCDAILAKAEGRSRTTCEPVTNQQPEMSGQ